MKTKVWIVIWGLKDGGAETLARAYASLLDKERFDAAVVTMYPFENTANYQRAREAGLKILPVFKRRNVLTRAVRSLAGKWYVPLVLKRILRKEKPDAIHLNSQMAGCFVRLKKQLSGIQLFYTCHSDAKKYFSKEEEAAVWQLARSNDLRLIALHEQMREELDRKFARDDTVVIKNGIDLGRFRETLQMKEETLHSIGIPRDAYVVGHIGRFSKEKNHAFLLQVFRCIAERKENAHLLLIGSGELREEILQTVRENRLEERVTVLSHRTDIPELLHAMDVLVFPSLFEGLSVTLVEAQAAGLKCVVSDTVNPESFLSPRTIPVSLRESARHWADIALDDTCRNREYGNIEAYDMNREIHRLEGLYQGQLDV